MKLVCEDINSFVRNQDPKKALNLGYEAKIRNLFRSFNVPDENYKVKEDGEVVFNGGLSLNYTQIRELPANLTVKRWLFLRNTQIRELPANLTVNGGIDLRNTQIRELPASLTVERNIYVNGDQTELINFIEGYKFKDKLKIL